MTAGEARRELQAAGRRYEAARVKLKDARFLRDKEIVKASRIGLTRREVARHANVTSARVQQILDWYAA